MDAADANELRFPEFAGVERVGATGGPYLTPAQARDIVLDGMQCAFREPSASGNTCSEVDVTFFSRYEDAWFARGGNHGVVVGGWAADHEVYVVTVKGSFTLPFTGRGGGFRRISHRTYEVDATTGQVGLSGGVPLPAGTPGVVTFRES